MGMMVSKRSVSGLSYVVTELLLVNPWTVDSSIPSCRPSPALSVSDPSLNGEVLDCHGI